MQVMLCQSVARVQRRSGYDTGVDATETDGAEQLRKRKLGRVAAEDLDLVLASLGEGRYCEAGTDCCIHRSV